MHGVKADVLEGRGEAISMAGVLSYAEEGTRRHGSGSGTAAPGKRSLRRICRLLRSLTWVEAASGVGIGMYGLRRRGQSPRRHEGTWFAGDPPRHRPPCPPSGHPRRGGAGRLLPPEHGTGVLAGTWTPRGRQRHGITWRPSPQLVLRDGGARRDGGMSAQSDRPYRGLHHWLPDRRVCRCGAGAPVLPRVRDWRGIR
jgi:hypothetical protein